MKLQGADENEIENSLDALMPLSQVATITGQSIETVKENRQQVVEARKTTGIFSKETREARQDLRADRKATRQAAIRNTKVGGTIASLFGR